MKKHSWSHVISLYAAKAGDPYDRRHQCDPAAPAEADGPRASSLQRCVAQPSPASPHHPVQHRSAHNSHGPSNPAGPDRQHCLTPTGVAFSLQTHILHQFLDVDRTNSSNIKLNSLSILKSAWRWISSFLLSVFSEPRLWLPAQIQGLAVQRDPSHCGLWWHHVHVARCRPTMSALCGPHPSSNVRGPRASWTAMRQSALPLPPWAPGNLHRDAGDPEACFWSCPARQLEHQRHNASTWFFFRTGQPYVLHSATFFYLP